MRIRFQGSGATLKDDLWEKFQELGQRLIEQESWEINRFCADAVKWTDRGGKSKAGWTWGEYGPTLCGALLEIKYFMNGVELRRKYEGWTEDKAAEITELTPDEAYRRCIVGTVALAELYGDHCQLMEVIEKVKTDIGGTVDAKLKNHLNSGTKKLEEQLNKCEGKIDLPALMFGKALLHGKIKQWTKEEREKGNGGAWKLGQQWEGKWKPRCVRGKRTPVQIEEARKRSLQNNKESLMKFSGMKEDVNGERPGSVPIADILADTDGKFTIEEEKLGSVLQSSLQGNGKIDVSSLTKKIKDATEEKLTEECMKNSSKKFCQRLECAQQHWNLTKEKSNTNTFWGEHIKNELGNLFNRGATSSSTQHTNCDNDSSLDNANKEACKLFTAKLEFMYKKSNGATKGLSDQMINCLLLKEYAKKLNEQAKEKGYCSMEDGMKKAFKSWKPTTDGKCTNGSGPCIECKWDDEDYDHCKIDTSSTSNDSVENKVKELFNDRDQTKDPQIQQTLATFNKENTLCKRIECAAKSYENNGGQGSGKGTFWNEHVQNLWNELAGKMKDNGGKGNGDCEEVKDGTDNRTATPSEKTACNYLHAALKHLYTTLPSSSTDGIWKNNPSLRQAMGCFLLHLYAKHMKEKAICNIEKGISRAFELGDKLSNGSTNGNCSGAKGPCVPCKWDENILSTCEIKANGSSDPDEKVEKKWDGIVTKDDAAVTAAAKEMNEVKDLCKRFQCISERWLKDVKKKGQNGDPLKATDWNDVWKEVKKEIPKLRTALGSATTTTNGGLGEYCKGLDEKGGKDACILIAAGLKNLYNTPGDDVNASFQRTMQCVLLNAIADKMREELPCKEERSVTEGIEHAFKESGNIKNKSSGCNDANKCFTCPRFTEYRNCKIKEYSNAEQVTMLKDKVDEVFNKNEGKAQMEKIQDQAVKDICKPCTEKTFCESLTCVAEKWEKRNKGTSTGTTTWEKMKGEFETELKLLLEDMKAEANQAAVAGYCNGNGSAGWEDGAAKEANQAACKLVAAGLQRISSIQHEYSTQNGLPRKNKNPFDHQDIQQVLSCLLLKTFVKEMKKRSKICDIQPGVDAATRAWKEIKEKCTKQPCIECNLKDDDINNDNCQIGTENVNVKEKLNEILEDRDYKTSVNETLSAITKTDEPGAPFCNRLQCIEARVKAQQAQTQGRSNAEKFWKTDGEVGILWNQLAQAMKDNRNDQSECNTVDNDREPTDPEKKACNFLHAGFKELYTPATGAPSPTGDILSQHPLLRQTMGCFLLKEYAKQMKEKANCLVESGIKKAFESWKPITNGTCSGKEPCVPCQWEDKSIDNCNITTSGSTTENAKDKLKTVLPPDGDKTVTDTLTKINETESLCAKLQCAAPKWFHNQKNKGGSSGTNKKSWCNFWDEGVKPTLQSMFKQIESDAKNKPNTTICRNFGDGNPDSVERKACNHIIAGLEHINDIPPSGSGGNGKDNSLLDRAVGCIALNMYADKIINEAKEKCPIDETTINKMFTKWNEKNNSLSSPSSSCNGGGNNNNCFICIREPDFKGCNLSVDSNLINTSPSQPNGQKCNDNKNKDNKNVQKQMKKLLEDNNPSQSNINTKIKSTLTTITEMTSSFCTQVQCAIKKKLKNNNGKTLPNGTITQPWDALEKDIGRELNELLEYMTKGQSQSDLLTYCDKDAEWNQIGHKEGKTNKAACLLFAAGLQHIYTHGNGRVNGPSFGQTMGCLFLKEYAKQLKEMAKKQKEYKVHPKCSVEDGIKHAFEQSAKIMNDTPPCKNNGNSCFVCKQNEDDYKDCLIGSDSVKSKVESLIKDDQNKEHMQQTLENTVCPILLTDLLTPFLPLAPVSIGLSAMAYYLWKYFGPLGKGGPRFRRSPTEIPGSSVQEQLLDHVEEAGSHEYQLVKERKPRSAPTRTKRSGPVNRRTIIEIHFEVLDECQKGDTQLNQKDFLELLVQEFMGSEFMEEEQVPKEEFLMEGVPMELVPIEEVPSLGSGLLV
ncbi:SICAvar type I [Plasmodium knowlesi]|uniref:SICAvar type I n=1 Tax=Plasmodium knowlesi TaxID=5850 RepID=A0A1Y3DRM6_PLAKN|nr:SICAvar type I [Plasmodium knowlesi]